MTRRRKKVYQGRYPVGSMVKDNWADYAACAPQNAGEDWDPGLHYDQKRIEQAKAVCASCPVISECLDFARANVTTSGIWGGKSFWPNRPGRQPDRERGRQAA